MNIRAISPILGLTIISSGVALLPLQAQGQTREGLEQSATAVPQIAQITPADTTTSPDVTPEPVIPPASEAPTPDFTITPPNGETPTPPDSDTPETSEVEGSESEDSDQTESETNGAETETPSTDPISGPSDPDFIPPPPPGDAPPPPPPTFDNTPQTTEPPAAPEPQVLVSEVVVEGTEGELVTAVYEAISTRPGQTATRSQIQSDINAIYKTGFFSNVQAAPSDTPLGVRVTYVVQPNPILRSVQLAGNEVLQEEKVDEIFASQYNKTLNLNDLQSGIEAINQYYQDSGYVLGQVIGSPQIDRDGTVTLQVAEGVIEDVAVRYQNDEGEPKKGKTKPYILTREMRTKPGEVLNQNKLQADLQRIFGLGLFEDVQVALEPGEDPRKVVINLNVQERKTGSFSAGGGFSSRSGFFGTGSYSQSNFLGRNYRINAQAQVGTRELLFDASFTNPWIKGDPFRTSYTANVFNRLTRPLVFDGGIFDDTVLAPGVNPDNVNLNNPDCSAVLNPGANNPCDVRLPPEEDPDNPGTFLRGDTPRINRLGGGISFTRPLSKNPDKWANGWVASAGIRYERISSRDGDLDLAPVDELGNPLTFSGVRQQRDGLPITRSQDDILSVQLGIARDQRNDATDPTKGNLLRIGAEQALPIGSGSISFTRLRASYSQFFPVSLLKLTEGPQALAFNVQGGTIIGSLPPYEAFTIGGSNSVRGFNDGEVGSGRSFLQATAEYRFPLINFLGGIGGVLFVDYGTVLGTDSDVPGQPSIIRGKPGDGFGFGAGVRVKTPIGPVRIDYAINDDGDDQVHFGFGQRF